jgi:hypothetical protein
LTVPLLPKPPSGRGLGLDNPIPAAPANGKPTNDDERNSEQVKQPPDNHHGESRTVRARNVVSAHTTVGSHKGSQDDDQGDGAEKGGEELQSSAAYLNIERNNNLDGSIRSGGDG